MSLGGKGFFGLKDEIQRAVDAGMIVMAAAGNYVRTVTAPSQLRQLSGRRRHRTRRHPLGRLLRGIAVDVSMPGSCVHVAAYDDNMTPVVRMANGTSYAVAHLAAAAALWLAHHGRQSLINTYGVKRIQAAFLHNLALAGRLRGTARVGIPTTASVESICWLCSRHRYPGRRIWSRLAPSAPATTTRSLGSRP